MPINKIADDVQKMVARYNFEDKRVEFRNIAHYFRSEYIPQELGYAVQELKQQKKMFFNRKRGWIVR